MSNQAQLPAVTVVVPTKDRPELLRRAVDSIVAQDYEGPVHTLVVYDGTDPDFALCRGGRRTVTVASNARKPGLAGARNTGVVLSGDELVAFCDDDDAWLPGKLTAQVEAMRDTPEATLVTCGIRIEYGEETTDRNLDADHVTLADLLRNRLPQLHSSTFLFDRQWLVDNGLVNEEVPGSFGEDYDLLLRTARDSAIRNLRDVHVLVRWHEGRNDSDSHFVRRWDTMETALRWLLEEYPEFAEEPAGRARITGQIAFADAALGQRSDAMRWAKQTLRNNPREARAYLALMVSTGLVKPDTVLRQLHRRGRSI